MKKGLLGSTALVAATALTVGMAQAAEAPTATWTGNVNFQVYAPSGDITGVTADGSFTTGVLTPLDPNRQDASIYFGVDEAELQLNVKGTADNGLNYGFKIEINANTTDGAVADEARLSLGGSWGTLQMGDEDGAEDIMNFGGETLLGAAGSWDGDGDDVMGDFADFFFPVIAGDTSDHTKISYFSPRFSGFQVGGSYTPEPTMDGDEKKNDSDFENHFGLGANYDGTFGSVRVRASAVYSSASSNVTGVEDIGAYSVGGIVGFGPVSVAANWTDNADSGALTVLNFDDSYWNAALSYEAGPIYLSGSYFARTTEVLGVDIDSTAYGVTADYSLAPGLTVYAEYTAYGVEVLGADADENVFIAGANISF